MQSPTFRFRLRRHHPATGGSALAQLGLGRANRRPAPETEKLTPDHTVVTPLAPAPRRDEPALRFHDDRSAPAGEFAASAVPNALLRSEHAPRRGASWDDVASFATTYDGYGYWNELAELGNRAMQRWTRDRSLPGDLDSLRGCLFYEQRRWHHFGEEPNGRGAEYIWALIDAIRARVTFAGSMPVAQAVNGTSALGAPSAASRRPRASSRTALAAVPVAAPPPPAAAKSAPLPPPPAAAVLLPPPPAPVRSAAPSVAVFVDDDAGYLAWVGEHGDGYVANAARGSSTRGLKLHRARCSSIAGPAGSKSYTATYRKVCAANAEALLDWCVETLGSDPDPCQRCQP